MRDNRTPQQKLASTIKSAIHMVGQLPAVTPVLAARTLLYEAEYTVLYDTTRTLNLLLGAQAEVSTLAEESARLNCNVKSARLLLRSISKVSTAVMEVYAVADKEAF